MIKGLKGGGYCDIDVAATVQCGCDRVLCLCRDCDFAAAVPVSAPVPHGVQDFVVQGLQARGELRLPGRRLRELLDPHSHQDQAWHDGPGRLQEGGPGDQPERQGQDGTRAGLRVRVAGMQALGRDHPHMQNPQESAPGQQCDRGARVPVPRPGSRGIHQPHRPRPRQQQPRARRLCGNFDIILVHLFLSFSLPYITSSAPCNMLV